VLCVTAKFGRQCLRWVTNCRSTTPDKTVTFLPLIPQLRTYPDVPANFPLIAKNGLIRRSMICRQNFHLDHFAGGQAATAVWRS